MSQSITLKELTKEQLKEIFIKEVFNISSAKYFKVNKDSYLYKNIEICFEKFYKQIIKT